MNELENLVWVEKYRPASFDDIILNDKKLLLDFLKNPETLPNFIFHSNKPGTGKTSCAKIICNYLNCDFRIINSSMERGIDIMREEVSLFARTVGMNKVKKCVFLDESDGLCLEENTEIIIIKNNKKKIVKIKDVLDKKIKVLSYDTNFQSIIIDDAIGLNSGNVEMYEIELEDGRKIQCSIKHPFFQKDSSNKNKIVEKKLSELKKGDEIIDFK